MNEGWWIRYGGKRTGVYPVDDHEQWLRAGCNAARLGLPKGFLDRHGRLGRERLLLLAMRTAPAMRCRGHGSWVAFEFWNARNREAFRSIRRWGIRAGAGDLLLLSIINLRTGRRFRPMWLVFEDAIRNGRAVRSVDERRTG